MAVRVVGSLVRRPPETDGALDAVREALEIPRYRIRHGEYTERVDDAQMSFEDLLLLS